MSKLIVFFIVASVGAALILVVLIFLFCRARNKQTRHEKKVRSYSNGKIKEDIYKAVDTSEFPFQLREVTGQTSSNIFKREHLTNNVGSWLSQTNDDEYFFVDYRSASIQPNLLQKRLSDAEMRQRKISQLMLAHLQKQGKQVLGRTLNLLGEELNDDNLTGSDLSFQSYGRERESSSSYGKSRSSCPLADLEDGCHDYSEIGKFKKLSETNRNGGGSSKTVYKKTGKLIFTTKFSEAQRTLAICIVKAFDLVSKTPADQLNCFITAYLQPGKQQKCNTKYHKGTKDPLINEELVFRNIEKESFRKYKLCFKAYHYSKLKTNDLIGEVEIALSSVSPEIQGTFHVDFLRMRKKANPGAILISLCHQATIQKLEVIIQEAKNLHGSTSKLHPYVTASLYDEARVQTRETLIRKTKNPEFNEALSLSLHTNISNPIDVYSLVVAVNSRNKIGRDEIIGYVIFSGTSPQATAAEQWKKIKAEPHKQYSDWHALIDPSDI